MADIKVGDSVVGKVTGVENYGIFVNVDDYNGLIHISEISSNFVKDVHLFAAVGDEITAKVIEINKKNKQLKLSIKEFETDSKQAKREKIVETKNGFDSIANKLGEWISTKMDEINSKK